MITKVLFLFILIAVNAFFAASEIALISLNDNKLKIMADEGNKKAKHLVKILSEPSKFLATIQIGITLAGFLASAFAAESFSDPIVEMLKDMNLPVSDSVLKVTTVAIITMILSYFTLVLGELVPKRIAMQKADSIAFFVVTPLSILSKITSPFVKFLTLSTNGFVRIFGIDPNAEEENVTEEEIRMMIDVGEEKGTIHEREKMMINNIFEFNDKTAEHIMTHRTELVSIPVTAKLEEIIEMIDEEKYTRIPVFEENIDNIIGILHVKDLISLINNEQGIENFDLKDIIRKPFLIPIHKKIDELFVELQLAKTHMAIVIDEYGGTAGILTIEDLVEEIVGNIFDEYDEEEVELRQINATTFEVNGMISLSELEKLLDVELPTDEFETLNGFIISLFGNIPPKGKVTEIRYKHLRIQTIEVTDKRIEKVMVYVESKTNDEQLDNH